MLALSACVSRILYPSGSPLDVAMPTPASVPYILYDSSAPAGALKEAGSVSAVKGPILTPSGGVYVTERGSKGLPSRDNT